MALTASSPSVAERTSTIAVLTVPNLRRPPGPPARTRARGARRRAWTEAELVRHWRRSLRGWFESPPLRTIRCRNHSDVAAHGHLLVSDRQRSEGSLFKPQPSRSAPA